MIFPRTPKPPPDLGTESRLPGERSGQGSHDLFKLIERDLRRRAGLPPKKKPVEKMPEVRREGDDEAAGE